MKLSLVLSTHAAKFEAVALKGDFEENIAKIASWGYDGVELAIRDPRLVDANELEKVIHSHGLIVPAIGTGQAWGEEQLSFTSADPAIRKTAIERVLSHIPLAAKLKAMIIIGLIRGVTPVGQTHARSIDYLVGGLQEITQAASIENVNLVLEPINRYETDLINTAREALELFERVGADNLGLLLDTFHMNIEEKNIEDCIKTCGERIHHFHVADSNRQYPGAGHLDFKTILGTLFETGYEGFVSGEFMPFPDADTAAQNSIAYLRQL